jgi:hypothetical protein
MGLELCEHLAGRDRPLNIATPEENIEQTTVSFSITAIEIDRTFDFAKRPVVIT